MIIPNLYVPKSGADTCSSFHMAYTSNSSRWLRIFTKRLSLSSSYMKSDSSGIFSSTGDCSGVWFRDGAGDGPLIESVGRRFLIKTAWWFSFVASDILCARGMSGFVLSGSLWHSTISIVSWLGDILVSSLSQILLCVGFSENRRWRDNAKLNYTVITYLAKKYLMTKVLTLWFPDGMFSALLAFRQSTLWDP